MIRFDAHKYFEKEIRDKMKLTVDNKYKYARISSMQHLEEVLDNFRYDQAFFAVDDTENGDTFKSGGGWMMRRTFVVYIIKQYDHKDMSTQVAALEQCREIYENTLKKLIKDKASLANQMVYLSTDRINYNEIPGIFANSSTGLFFMVPVDIPVDLSWKEEEWIV